MRFEVFKHPQKPTAVIAGGFSWWAFAFVWIWAFFNRLWLQGFFLLLADFSIGGGIYFLGLPRFLSAFYLPVRIFAGLKGNEWRSGALERRDFTYRGDVEAATAGLALIRANSGEFFRRGVAALSTSQPPLFRSKGFQKTFAIAALTWKAAFRFRLFLVIAVLLLGAVVGLPILIKDDGTARGFTQILLTYTLSVITALLGLSTLWLSCGTLARDIEECQMQMVAVKPIARWQIWLGKWLGILSLNAALLALSGACVYGLLQWRATRLPPDEQKILRDEVLVARGSAKEESVESEIDAQTDQLLKERLKQTPVPGAELPEVRKQIREQIKAKYYEVVSPGTYREWKIDLGLKKNFLRNQPLQLRIKFNAAARNAAGTFVGVWHVGVPTQTWESPPMSLAPDTFHEFEIPPNLFDEHGVLTIAFANFNNTALLFPLADGMEVLYREGGFGMNFARGLGIIFCWMALLAAMGLTAASFLSFPVAAFFSFSLLTMALSSGTLATAVSEGTIGGYNSEAGTYGHSALDMAVIPAFRAALAVINLAKNFSPIDSLSTGRSIPWTELGLAFTQIVMLLGGIIGLIGIVIFSRRELATAQGNQ